MGAWAATIAREISNGLGARLADLQIQKADERRDVGNAGDPQTVRRVRLEVALDPLRRRPGLYISARRAQPAAPAHARDARRTHHPCDPLAADRDAGFGQFGVNPWRTVRSPIICVRSYAGRQVRIGLGPELRVHVDATCSLPPPCSSINYLKTTSYIGSNAPNSGPCTLLTRWTDHACYGRDGCGGGR